MVLIKDMEMPKCCPGCRLKDGYYRECNVKHKKIKAWLETNERRPDWCPLTEVAPYGPDGILYKEI